MCGRRRVVDARACGRAHPSPRRCDADARASLRAARASRTPRDDAVDGASTARAAMMTAPLRVATRRRTVFLDATRRDGRGATTRRDGRKTARRR
jgi:hypothetical protein